ncbi:MAG TPA: hypothetical protein VGO07_00755 [Candidatus Saccharimonadales bacterium]|jgi:hypothetical protein|nr:hypothetical protein [Candidatus Saccharimonadales bacterium]
MSTERLDAFVHSAMGVNGNIPTLGGAAGIFGITSMGANTVHELKRAVISFATEYRKNAASEAALHLGKEIEGLLSTLQVMSVITDERHEQLVDDLQELTGKVSIS